jgi:lysozyme
MTNLRDLLLLHEGRIPHAYTDSLGYLTIGVGHLIDRRKGGSLPDHIIDLLLEWDIAKHQGELFRALPWTMELDDVRKAVLTDMTFNLGIAGLLGFKNTLAAVKEHRWDDAAKGMLRSRWAQQVGPRALRLADMMRSGRWPGEVFVGPY